MVKVTLSFLTSVKEKIDKINTLFLIIVLFMIFLFPLLIHNYLFESGDLAEYLNNPVRIIRGELPYRDFWLLFPPGEVFLPAILYKIFGLNINILLIFSIIISAFVGLFSFLLGRLIFRDNFLAIISAILVFFNGITAHYPCYTYIHIYFLLLIISAFFFIKYLRNDSNTELFLTGFFCGIASLFRFYEVDAAFLAFFLIIFIHLKFDRKPFIQSFKSIAVFGSGFLIFVGLAFLTLIEIWRPMVRAIAIESLSHGTKMNLPYFFHSIEYLGLILADLKGIWENGGGFYIARILYHFVNFINITVLYLLPFFLAGVTIRYLFDRRLNKTDKVTVLLFLLWGMFTFTKALGRSDISHLTPSISIFFFLLIFLLQKSIQEFKKYRGSFKNIAYGFVVITLLLLASVPLLFVRIVYTLMKPHYEVRTKYGSLLLSSESEAKSINAIISFIKESTKEGDYIFVTPWYAPPFYALTNRKNPTYYDSLIDLVARPSEEKQIKVCSELLNKDTKLIIHYADWGFDDKKELQFINTCPILQSCIEDNFKLVKKYENYWIYAPQN